MGFKEWLQKIEEGRDALGGQVFSVVGDINGSDKNPIYKKPDLRIDKSLNLKRKLRKLKYSKK
jgi:hypothetical protein